MISNITFIVTKMLKECFFILGSVMPFEFLYSFLYSLFLYYFLSFISYVTVSTLPTICQSILLSLILFSLLGLKGYGCRFVSKSVLGQ